jgi:hypothetical protein
MRKVNLFLSAVAIIAVLTILQRFYLDQSDTGKAWAVMGKWFGLCDWFVRRPRLLPVRLSATATVDKTVQARSVTRTRCSSVTAR